jgi:hypothetical protein
MIAAGGPVAIDHRSSFWRSAITVSSLAAFSLLAFLSGVVQSQAPSGKPLLDVKLGLWEATMNSETQGAPPIDTSTMTPEQRARVEALLQAQGARGNSSRTRTSKSCLTKEKLEKGFLEDPSRKTNDCKQTVLSSSTTQLHLKVECNAEGRGMSGEFNFVALSRESVKGETIMALGVGGRGMTSKTTMTAKWLGPDCGDIK